jgi:hypothetical protein
MNPDDDDDEQNKNIRTPDPVIRETLLGTTSNNYGYNISNISNNVNNNYYDSIYDFEEDDCVFFEDILKQSIDEYEKEQLKMHIQNELLEKERLEKKLICNSITQKISRVKGHDTSNQEIYETILSIIEMYELEHIINFVVQQYHHEKIFKILSSIRLTSDEMQFLRNLIIV